MIDDDMAAGERERDALREQVRALQAEITELRGRLFDPDVPSGSGMLALVQCYQGLRVVVPQHVESGSNISFSLLHRRELQAAIDRSMHDVPIQRLEVMQDGVLVHHGGRWPTEIHKVRWRAL